MSIHPQTKEFNVELSAQPSCLSCSISSLCLPLSLNLEDMERLDSIIKRRRPIQRGEFLYRQGQEFEAVYAVRSGSVKSYLSNKGKEVQVTGFHLPSELVGLDSVDCTTHPTSALALETSTVCEIPFSSLQNLSEELPDLRQQFMSCMSKEIRSDKKMLLLLAKKNAEQKISIFLLNISARFKKRGYSAFTFRLPMSRGEMANYLGLSIETISRVLTRFQELEILTVDLREIHIADSKQLFEIANIRDDFLQTSV